MRVFKQPDFVKPFCF